MRTRPILCAALAAAVAAGLTACSPRYVRSQPGDLVRTAPPERAITTNVVLVSIDGLRPDAIARFSATHLQRLMGEGSYSLSARTIMPSKTLPSHTSMLTGEPPEEHGVVWNNVVSARADVVESPTVFSIARAHGYRTAAFFSKAKFGPLQRPGTLDYSQAPGGWFGRWSSARTMGDVRSYLENERPNLLFVHLSDPDRAGHSSGWMSEAYGRAVRSADAAVGALLIAAEAAYGKGNYSVLVTADHGGHEFDHGSDDPQDVMIPWIAWGRGVTIGALEHVAIETFDTASTVLWLLGIEEPEAWNGSVVRAAFQPVPTATE
ncbi:MAG: hypothetical protein A3F70_17335 [Acidobacteria bacterium RIFCSPLOWO2_12_FULL_67_14]|nr:MAG: hypothetical protein A3H29_07910 [Acidobacteria bacterium RIFCSPLOWO2_02_FULL_67_21]OFW35949.1 MAG: hypothetical protein A3F70_17335 [Acidobacteria bacterium RIFCSPLOWO2_12_FULL_67_14]